MKILKRPYGYSKRIITDKNLTVIILEINPNETLSLHKHKKRKETVYFLTKGYVQLNNKFKEIKEGTILNIKQNVIHRIYSKNKKVKIIEFVFGKFNQKDIIRLEDKYGRK